MNRGRRIIKRNSVSIKPKLIFDVLLFIMIFGILGWLIFLQVNSSETFQRQDLEIVDLNSKVTMLKSEVLALEICQNTSYAGAVVSTNSSGTFNQFFDVSYPIDVNWTSVQWDDAMYFNPLLPARLTAPVTARYAFAINMYDLTVHWEPSIPSSTYSLYIQITTNIYTNTSIAIPHIICTSLLQQNQNDVVGSSHFFNTVRYCELELEAGQYLKTVFTTVTSSGDLEGNNLIVDSLSARSSIRLIPSPFPGNV